MIASALTHRRRLIVGQYWLRGYSERQIAEMIRAEASNATSPLHGCEKTTHVTVHKDVVALREQWLARANARLDAQRAEQVARLMDTIHQAWADFNNCKRGNIVREVSPEGAVTTVTEANTWYLRPLYMRVALEAEEKIAKILGTLAPTKLAGADGGALEIALDAKDKIISALNRIVAREGTEPGS